MPAQHHGSRKRSLKVLREVLPTLTIEEITTKTAFNSEYINFRIDVYSPNNGIGHVDINLHTYKTIPTEKYGDLGVVSISIDTGTKYAALGIPNKAFYTNRDGSLDLIGGIKWDVYGARLKEDDFLSTVFENDFIADFVKKVLEKLKDRHNSYNEKRQKTLLVYPAKANKYALEVKKLEYEMCLVTALLETINCLKQFYSIDKPAE